MSRTHLALGLAVTVLSLSGCGANDIEPPLENEELIGGHDHAHEHGNEIETVAQSITGSYPVGTALITTDALNRKQRINYNDGRGWQLMEDRGSITQNHYDHVHVSFYQ